MNLKDVLPDYLPLYLKTLLGSILEPSDSPPMRYAGNDILLKKVGAKSPFIKIALASDLAIEPLRIITALIFNNTMRDAWIFIQDTNDNQQNRLMELFPDVILEAAVNTYLKQRNFIDSKTNVQNELHELEKLLNRLKNIIQNQKKRVEKFSYNYHGGLDALAYHHLFLKFKIKKKEVDTLEFIDTLISNTNFYQSMHKKSLVDAEDFTAIKREPTAKSALIRTYIGMLKSRGVLVKHPKSIKLVTPAVTSVILQVLEAPVTDVNDKEVRNAIKDISDAENAFFRQYDDFLNGLLSKPEVFEMTSRQEFGNNWKHIN